MCAVRCVNQTTYNFLAFLLVSDFSFLIIVMYTSTDLANLVNGNTLRLLNGHLLLLVPLSQRFQLLLVLLDHLISFKTASCLSSIWILQSSTYPATVGYHQSGP